MKIALVILGPKFTQVVVAQDTVSLYTCQWSAGWTDGRVGGRSAPRPYSHRHRECVHIELTWKYAYKALKSSKLH